MASWNLLTDLNFPDLIARITGGAVTQTAGDSTAGRLLKTGDAGLLVNDTAITLVADMDAHRVSGIFRWDSATVGLPVAATVGAFIHITRASAASTGAAYQLAFVSTGELYVRRMSASAWNAWRQVPTIDLIANMVFLAASGTAALPGFAFSSDPNTGLFNPGADQIGVSTGGVQRALMSTTALQLDLPLTGTSVTQNSQDNTAGRLMRVGDAGWLGFSPSFGAGTSWEALTQSQIISAPAISAQPTDKPLNSGTSFVGVHLMASLTRWADFVVETTGSTAGRMYSRSHNAGVTTPWVRLLVNGDYGFGAEAPALTDLTTNPTPGLYRFFAASAVGSPNTESYECMVLVGLTTTGYTYLAWRYATSASTMKVWTGSKTLTSGASIIWSEMLKVGDFGLGGVSVDLTATDNLDTLTPTGFYYNPSAGNATGNNYPIISAGSLLNIRRNASNWTQYFITAAASAAPGDTRAFMRSARVGPTWGPWVEILKVGDYGIGSVTGQVLADLNDQTVASGIYYCVNGTTANNTIDGAVFTGSVYIAQRASGARTTQFAITEGTNNAIYQRSYNTGAWGAWKKLLVPGDYGLGSSINLPSSSVDLALLSGTYLGYGGGHVSASGGTNPYPTFNGAFTLQVVKGNIGGADEYVTQIATAITITLNASAFPATLVRSKTTTASGWTAWQELITPARLNAVYKQVFVGTSAPASPSVGDLWLDTN